jgi:hypothetical protein
MHVWSDLARDLPGILLFLLWLALPPLYLYAVGQTYLRRYQALYQQLRAHHCECACCRGECACSCAHCTVTDGAG